MKSEVLFVGLDVDDKSFSASAISECGTKEFQFRCKPSAGALDKVLKEFKAKGFELRLCYEAGFLGFSLYRDLMEKGYSCTVIAPSLIPTLPGKQVKTDRLDSKKLASFFRTGLLTSVNVPDEEEEVIRDMIRSRKFITFQLKALRNHILFQCRRMRLDYRSDRALPQAEYWTKTHVRWLDGSIDKLKNPQLKMNFSQLLTQLKFLEEQIAFYDHEIERLGTEDRRYQEKVKALCCYRGIKTLTAMTLITEIGDIKRFGHPKRLTSYAGMDLREYSSGGKEHKFSMSKLGNRHIRTCVVESSQLAWTPPKVSRDLGYRRAGVDPKYIEIADRCMKRLHKKSTHLLLKGKSRNKVKTACARELLSFVWESLRAAA